MVSRPRTGTAASTASRGSLTPPGEGKRRRPACAQLYMYRRCSAAHVRQLPPAALRRVLCRVQSAAPGELAARAMFPRELGAFARAARDVSEYRREGDARAWGLVLWFAKTAKLPFSTNDAAGRQATAATFKQSWARGHRCIIPAAVFFKPNWESGKNDWWAFKRADPGSCGLAGLWSTWTDRPRARWTATPGSR